MYYFWQWRTNRTANKCVQVKRCIRSFRIVVSLSTNEVSAVKIASGRNYTYSAAIVASIYICYPGHLCTNHSIKIVWRTEGCHTSVRATVNRGPGSPSSSASSPSTFQQGWPTCYAPQVIIESNPSHYKVKTPQQDRCFCMIAKLQSHNQVADMNFLKTEERASKTT